MSSGPRAPAGAVPHTLKMTVFFFGCSALASGFASLAGLSAAGGRRFARGRGGGAPHLEDDGLLLRLLGFGVGLRVLGRLVRGGLLALGGGRGCGAGESEQ